MKKNDILHNAKERFKFQARTSIHHDFCFDTGLNYQFDKGPSPSLSDSIHIHSPHSAALSSMHGVFMARYLPRLL